TPGFEGVDSKSAVNYDWLQIITKVRRFGFPVEALEAVMGRMRRRRGSRIRRPRPCVRSQETALTCSLVSASVIRRTSPLHDLAQDQSTEYLGHNPRVHTPDPFSDRRLRARTNQGGKGRSPILVRLLDGVPVGILPTT
ncbi:MAG: hypothetical protein M3N18_02280, partial [Actinomycetota bacterium]|nr:hypothetical protein [Actinomycetota bacterium]